MVKGVAAPTRGMIASLSQSYRNPQKLLYSNRLTIEVIFVYIFNVGLIISYVRLENLPHLAFDFSNTTKVVNFELIP